MNQKEVGEFIKTFHFLQRFDCLSAIDEMFLKLIKEDWSKESFTTNKMLIVTFCRANSKIRKRLKYYQPFLDKSINYCNENSFDPNKILKGIL